MAVETHPQLQIFNSTTPAITKKSLEAAEAAKVQAMQQEQMMRQVMTMFSPQGMQGQQSLGNMMQPTASPATSPQPQGPVPNGQPLPNPQQTPVQASAQTQKDATTPQQPQVSRQQMPGSMPQSRTR